MEKVICINCGSSGYTASPRHVPCSDCGGRYRVVEDTYPKIEALNRDQVPVCTVARQNQIFNVVSEKE